MSNVIIYKKTHADKNLTRNFKLSEFHCKCQSHKCKKTYIAEELLVVLQLIRMELNKSIHINCAYRCEEHNEAVGGVKNSQHVLGKAADIVIKGMSANDTQEYLIARQPELGITIGRYNTFTHIDVRENPTVFDKRKR